MRWSFLFFSLKNFLLSLGVLKQEREKSKKQDKFCVSDMFTRVRVTAIVSFIGTCNARMSFWPLSEADTTTAASCVSPRGPLLSHFQVFDLSFPTHQSSQELDTKFIEKLTYH
jgi:hypothetical protein